MRYMRRQSSLQTWRCLREICSERPARRPLQDRQNAPNQDFTCTSRSARADEDQAHLFTTDRLLDKGHFMWVWVRVCVHQGRRVPKWRRTPFTGNWHAHPPLTPKILEPTPTEIRFCGTAYQAAESQTLSAPTARASEHLGEHPHRWPSNTSPAGFRGMASPPATGMQVRDAC